MIWTRFFLIFFSFLDVRLSFLRQTDRHPTHGGEHGHSQVSALHCLNYMDLRQCLSLLVPVATEKACDWPNCLGAIPEWAGEWDILIGYPVSHAPWLSQKWWSLLPEEGSQEWRVLVNPKQ